jgi:hypothetical protein
MGCSEAEWLSGLPGAVRNHALTLNDGRACVAIEAGQLLLHWQVMPSRQIALVRIPRLIVRFHFDGVGDEARRHLMRYFDLYMHRGGG